MRKISLILAPLLLTLCHCAPPAAADVAQRRGSEDLSCPLEEVHAYRAEGGRYVARGCGHWVQYDCISTGAGRAYATTTCVSHVRPELHDLAE